MELEKLETCEYLPLKNCVIIFHILARWCMLIDDFEEIMLWHYNL